MDVYDIIHDMFEENEQQLFDEERRYQFNLDTVICPECNTPTTQYKDRTICEECGRFMYNPYAYTLPDKHKPIKGSTYVRNYHANKLIQNSKLPALIKMRMKSLFDLVDNYTRIKYGKMHMPKYNLLFNLMLEYIICEKKYFGFFKINLNPDKIKKYNEMFIPIMKEIKFDLDH